MESAARPVLWLVACLIGSAPALAIAALPRDPPERSVQEGASGRVYQWQSSAGQPFEYYIPTHYDPILGANLTLFLHDAGEDRRYAFRTLEAGEFRPDDIVVAPEGVEPSAQGGGTFLQGEVDLLRIKSLLDELREALAIQATFLFGHGEGASFALAFAATYPADVQGVLAHGGGHWRGTKPNPAQHQQAFAWIHGTDDPIVPYERSLASLGLYQEAGFPLLHVRTLEGWNHWLYPDQAEQQLAWCEALTTKDPNRVAASLRTVCRQRTVLDPYVAYHVSQRALACVELPEELHLSARKLSEEVEVLARQHMDAIEQSLAGGRGEKVDGGPWLGLLRLFLRDFSGIPYCDLWARPWRAREVAHLRTSESLWVDWYRLAPKNRAEAFSVGLKILTDTFLARPSLDHKLRDTLQQWRHAKGVELKQRQQRTYDDFIPNLDKSLREGARVYWERNPRYGPPVR